MVHSNHSLDGAFFSATCGMVHEQCQLAGLTRGVGELLLSWTSTYPLHALHCMVSHGLLSCGSQSLHRVFTDLSCQRLVASPLICWRSFSVRLRMGTGHVLKLEAPISIGSQRLRQFTLIPWYTRLLSTGVPTNTWSVGKPIFDVEFTDDALLVGFTTSEIQAMIQALETETKFYALTLNGSKSDNLASPSQSDLAAHQSLHNRMSMVSVHLFIAFQSFQSYSCYFRLLRSGVLKRLLSLEFLIFTYWIKGCIPSFGKVGISSQNPRYHEEIIRMVLSYQSEWTLSDRSMINGYISLENRG